MSSDEISHELKILSKSEQIENKDVTANDMVVLKKQLNKKKMTEPRAILKRCKWGYPQVTFALSANQKGNNSLKKKSKPTMEFVPGTLMWLTCPRIRDYVSKLEADISTFNSIRRHFGIVKDTDDSEEHVNVDNLVKLHESFDNYNKWLIEHENLLSYEEFLLWVSANSHRIPHQDDEDEAAEPQENQKKRKRERADVNIEDIQQRFGNAGVGERDAIKCIHAHTGPFLAGVDDHVGRFVYGKASEKVKDLEGDIEDIENALDCRSDCIKCKIYDPTIKN
ncbi:trehalose-phosphate phosphatase D [Acrasis kona]|uniref:Trehalose-phosphate phosphatase D n=1 Tax=Acrasis kona TaxID=1008807 RepID=A0AAW2YJM3_9EUKA